VARCHWFWGEGLWNSHQQFGKETTYTSHKILELKLLSGITSKYFVAIYCFIDINATKNPIIVKKLTQKQPITHKIQVNLSTNPDISV